MRIIFIEPAAPGFHVYSFVRQLRLGLPLLGAMMAQRGHEVRIYAESLSDVDWDDVLSADLVVGEIAVVLQAVLVLVIVASREFLNTTLDRLAAQRRARERF